MTEFLSNSATWGTVLTLACFALFDLLRRKVRAGWCNPLLLSTLAISALLLLCRVPYADYKATSSVLSWLLLPATVSLAVPLYEQWPLLRKNIAAILGGIAAGVLASLACLTMLALLFHMEPQYAVCFLPKSVTTAIGADISAELSGLPALTIVLIILTGIVGNLLAPVLCRVFHLNNAIARGIAIGTASHAIGTSRALEMGQAEGAMSSLSIAVAGVLTALLCPVVAWAFFA